MKYGYTFRDYLKKAPKLKYLISTSLLVLILTGCVSSLSHTVHSEKKTSDVQTQLINFVGPMDLSIQLKSSDHFKTAEMTDNSDRVYYLKKVVGTDGVRLEDSQGVFIHFENGAGIVEFIKGRPINITEYKP